MIEKPIEFRLHNKRGADARGISVPDGFAVLKGSCISLSEVPSISSAFSQKRAYLINQGTINKDHVFNKNHVFSSPSTAAAVVLGRNANGRVEWKTEEGQTLKEIEEKQLP